MPQSIHLISRREGITLHGMSRWPEEPQGYQSCCWLISDEDATNLLGGWVYFHETKADPSGFGGVILGFAPGHDDLAHRKIIMFRHDRRARGQQWRGADHSMAYSSGLVEADLPHEAQ